MSKIADLAARFRHIASSPLGVVVGDCVGIGRSELTEAAATLLTQEQCIDALERTSEIKMALHKSRRLALVRCTKELLAAKAHISEREQVYNNLFNRSVEVIEQAEGRIEELKRWDDCGSLPAGESIGGKYPCGVCRHCEVSARVDFQVRSSAAEKKAEKLQSLLYGRSFREEINRETAYLTSRLTDLEQSLVAAKKVIRDLRDAYHMLHPHRPDENVGVDQCSWSLCSEPRVVAFLAPASGDEKPQERPHTRQLAPPPVANLDAAVARVRGYMKLVREGKPTPALTQEDVLVGQWLQVTESRRLDMLDETPNALEKESVEEKMAQYPHRDPNCEINVSREICDCCAPVEEK